MKNKISIYLLLAFTCLSLQSCLFSEENLFDKSSAVRASETASELKELLLAAPNGWALDYYIGENYSVGGITLLCRFEQEEKVTLMSEAGSTTIAPGTAVSSFYTVNSEESTVLSFNSYNELIHCFGEPVLMSNSNLEGDYEFIYMGRDGDKILLQGRKYHNNMVLTPLGAEVDWSSYISQLNEVEKESALEEYVLQEGGQQIGQAIKQGRLLSFVSEGMEGNVPFLYTTDGLRLREPIELGGKNVQHFKWNVTNMTFTCTDEGATDFVLEAVYPRDYVSYDDYLGYYYMTYGEYNGGGINEDGYMNLDQKMMVVQLQEKVRGETYTLTNATLEGEAAPIEVTYDRASGRLVIRQQRATIIGYDGTIGFGCNQGYVLPAYYGADFGNLASIIGMNFGLVGNQDPASTNISLIFSEYGNVFSSLVGIPATSLIFGAYSSDKLTAENYLGYVAWYDSIELDKY